jgi:hypothetical protein
VVSDVPGGGAAAELDEAAALPGGPKTAAQIESGLGDASAAAGVPRLNPIEPGVAPEPTPATAPGAATQLKISEPSSTSQVSKPSQPSAPAPGAEATAASSAVPPGRTAASEESFGDAEFDALLRDARNSEFGYRLEAGKRRSPAPLGEDTTRTRAQVDEAAHAAARRNPPAGQVPGAQIQHPTKTLDVTRNLPAGMNPLDVNTTNENTMWLQSRKNLPSTLLHVDPQGGGTRIYVDDIPRGRTGDAGMPGEQLDLFKPSNEFDPAGNPGQKLFQTEHKFADNYHIPEVSEQIARSRRDAGLPPLDPRMQAIAAGEQQR